MKSASIIREYLWLPLVTVSATQRSFLVQPGSPTLISELEPGKHWHWPYLTSIRTIDQSIHTYPINQDVRVAKDVFGDEPIVAATKDMRLVRIQGVLTIRANPKANQNTLAAFDRHSINRLIRPLIRSDIRLAVAEYNASQMTSVSTLTKRIHQLVADHLAGQGLKLVDIQLSSVSPFNPFKDPQSPAA